jgi:DNA-binding transcriptional LysR family regulator
MLHMDMKIYKLQDLQIFLAVAQAASFSVAARQLHISPMVVSAVIKRLEQNLETRLFERSTRRLRMSAAGERYLPYARQALTLLQEGEAALLQTKVGQSNWPELLRMSLPSDIARSGMLQWLEDFFCGEAQGSNVNLELHVSDRITDLLQQRIDFAVRYGALMDSSFISLPIHTSNRRILCASPGYLERFGTPDSLKSLAQHTCLRFVRGDTVYSNWQFTMANQHLTFEAKGHRIADDAGVVRLWALAGLGIAYKSELDVTLDIAAGRLRQILPELQGAPAPLHLVAVSKPHITDNVRKLATYLAKRCQELISTGH